MPEEYEYGSAHNPGCTVGQAAEREFLGPQSGREELDPAVLAASRKGRRQQLEAMIENYGPNRDLVEELEDLIKAACPVKAAIAEKVKKGKEGPEVG